jgi:2'-5' RNA ligase
MEPEFKQSAMIALLPITTDWCQIKLPHMTLVYAGETDKLKPTDFNELAKDACSIAMLSRSITLEVIGKEVFGNWTDNPADQVDVFRLRPTSELMAMRRMVDQWNASEHPFNPHVTIGPTGTSV